MKYAKACFSIFSVWILATAAMAQHYQQTNLVSDIPGLAAHTDPDLVNAWGLARGASTFWWVNDNGTGVATLYDPFGAKQGLVVSIPPPPGSTATSTPTGMVFNASTGFVVTGAGGAGPALFIFATEDGTISGWNPGADFTHAILQIDNSASAVYKGLAIADLEGTPLLYAANFTGAKIDVFDSGWHPTTVPGGFVDALIPQGFAPFNVQNIGGNLFVAYAKQGELPDEQAGRGLGFVDKFDSGGHLLMRLQHGPWLNAPWGLALAPADFGKFSNHLLVGQFGSGRIATFDASSGLFRGFVHDAKGPIVIEGLWALGFGGDAPNNGPHNTLFFTAGIDDEQHGLFGTLTAAKTK
jgi:uncharacterized protein (TIGR03118 family)